MSKTAQPTTTTTDSPQECGHENRTLDESNLYCFECWMSDNGSSNFKQDGSGEGI